MSFNFDIPVNVVYALILIVATTSGLLTDFTFTVNGPFIALAFTIPLDETVAYSESELDIS
jgi:hypothetical protein